MVTVGSLGWPKHVRQSQRDEVSFTGSAGMDVRAGEWGRLGPPTRVALAVEGAESMPRECMSGRADMKGESLPHVSVSLVFCASARLPGVFFERTVPSWPDRLAGGRIVDGGSHVSGTIALCADAGVAGPLELSEAREEPQESRGDCAGDVRLFTDSVLRATPCASVKRRLLADTGDASPLELSGAGEFPVM